MHLSFNQYILTKLGRFIILYIKKSGSSKSKNFKIAHFPIKFFFNQLEIKKSFRILDQMKVFCLQNKSKFKLNHKVKVCERNAKKRQSLNSKAFNHFILDLERLRVYLPCLRRLLKTSGNLETQALLIPKFFFIRLQMLTVNSLLQPFITYF